MLVDLSKEEIIIIRLALKVVKDEIGLIEEMNNLRIKLKELMDKPQIDLPWQ